MRIVLYGNFIVDFTSESHHARSLEALGHEVVRLQETTVDSPQVLEEAKKSDALVWIHSHSPDFERQTMPMEQVLDELRHLGIPTIAYHLDLYMPLAERWQHYKDSAYMNHLQYFFTVDKQMAEWLNENTTTKGIYLQAGVFHEECYLDINLRAGENRTPLFNKDVIFVGSRGYHQEWQYRPKLIDWLRANYGERFKHYGGDGLGVVRGDKLNQLYGDSKIAIGDSLCINYDYPNYWSDRVYETLGRGGFLIHPYIQGMGEHFEDGKHLVFYDFNNFEQLKGLIDYYLTHDAEREAIRLAGHNHVKAHHTYMQRWQTILEEVLRGRND